MVAYPLLHKQTEQRCRHSLVLLNIFVAMTTAVPYAIGANVDEDSRCVPFNGDTSDMALPYHVVVTVFYSVLPVLLTTGKVSSTGTACYEG